MFLLPGRNALFYDLRDPDWAEQSAQSAAQVRCTRNVYVAVGTQQARLESGRGKEETVIALPGLWADIDVRGPNHSSPDLPPTLDDAWVIIRSVPLEPTLVIRSGGGLQLYWLFREPLEIHTDQERRWAKALAITFLKHLNDTARTHGWRVDATADLARVLRLPGTYNLKNDPVLVDYAITDGVPRYNPSDFEEFLAFEADPCSRAHIHGVAPLQPRADFKLIAKGCAWIRRCQSDAASLPEPEWYRMLSVVSRCRNGRAIAHEISRPYLNYTPTETDAKFDQAFVASGPATCAYVATNLASSICTLCPLRGRIKSPVVLGLPKRRLDIASNGQPTPAADGTFGRIEDELEAAIASHDITRVYRMVDSLAELSECDLLVVTTNIEKNFGREFKSADFKRAIRLKRAEIKRNALTPNNLPRIAFNSQWVRNATEQALLALSRANQPPFLFVRSGEMVHVAVDELQRPTITPVSEHHLRGRLDRVADFVRTTEIGDRPIPVPMDVVRDVMALPSAEWKFPVLKSVVEVPSLRSDGTIVDVPGYDAKSGMFYAPAADLVAVTIPEQPIAEDVSRALAVIDEAIGEFPFADQTSKANALGLLISPLVRTAVQGCVPIALIDAPKAGTGKSLFVDVLSTIISGRAASMSPFPRTDEEMQKQIGATLMAGRPIVCFDNLESILQAPSLSLAITAKEYETRILGVSRNMTVPNNATWIVTGNNIRPSGDMPRRCYQIRLDARMSNPALGRRFRHENLLEWVRSNRVHLLHALLVLARYWYGAGAPALVDKPLGSFEAWHRTVGSMLVHAGIEGFLANMDDFVKNADEVANQWEGFLLTLSESFPNGAEFTVADLVAKIDVSESLRKALPDRVQHLLGRREGALQTELGKAFARRKDQRMGEFEVYLKRIGVTRTRAVLWSIVLPAHEPSA